MTTVSRNYQLWWLKSYWNMRSLEYLLSYLLSELSLGVSVHGQRWYSLTQCTQLICTQDGLKMLYEACLLWSLPDWSEWPQILAQFIFGIENLGLGSLEPKGCSKKKIRAWFFWFRPFHLIYGHFKTKIANISEIKGDQKKIYYAKKSSKMFLHQFCR